MNHLINRAVSTYRRSGLISTLRLSLLFISKHTRHKIGTLWLYKFDWYRRVLIWWNSGRGQYSDLADPFKIIWICPKDIQFVTERNPNPGRFQWQDIGRVRKGNWDQANQPVNELPAVMAVYQRFKHRRSWENIHFIKKVIEKSRNGITIWKGCKNKKDVMSMCDKIDQLYHNIEQAGYLTRKDLISGEIINEDKYVKGDKLERYNEIAVDIGRNGQFLFVDGRHRLAIAKILEIDKIPVRVSARHSQWQEVREIVAQTPQDELPASVRTHLDHPDLQDILNREK